MYITLTITGFKILSMATKQWTRSRNIIILSTMKHMQNAACTKYNL